MSAKDTVAKTLMVAGVLCVVCSIVVSGSAVMLKPTQEKNQLLDKKKNILNAAGMYQPGDDIIEKFKAFKSVIVDLETAEVVDGIDQATFNQKKRAKDPTESVRIPGDKDFGDIKRRSKLAQLYFVMNGDAIEKIILPIHGKGLWSTMYGFVALSKDTKVIEGITFYEHGETPGLGGEIDNANWKASWQGKMAFDENWNPAIRVIKGKVNTAGANAKYEIDGLSGATITARGVSGTMRYWLSDHGFGPFLEKLRQNQGRI